ncbi:MAG: hypothetical protein R3286_05295 [Gammaproteobacteria bacterium]|nr:hypothetical protein [Gammaproteobacteria bacterium]
MSSAEDHAGNRSRKKRRRRRGRRLTDKIRAAIARAAALGRRDITAQLSLAYQAVMDAEKLKSRKRRAAETGIRKTTSRPRA